MKNMEELRDKLVDIFNKVEKEEISNAKAKTLVRTAGTIVSTVKAQVSYHTARHEKPDIAFMQ